MIRDAVRVVGVAVASAFLLTACLNVETSTKVEGDGSGTLSMSVQLNEETVDALSGFGMLSGEDLFGDLSSEVGSELDGMTLVDFEEIENGFNATFTFDDYNDAADFLLAENDGFFDSVSVERDGDTWKFEADVSGIVEEFTGSSSGSADSSGVFGDFDGIEQLLSSSLQPELSFSFEFPGAVSDSNATSVDGAKATWEVNEGSPSTLTATWTPESGIPSALLLIAGVGMVVVVFIAVAALLLVVGRKERPAPPA